MSATAMKTLHAGRPRVYSNEQLIRRLQQEAKRIGRTPTCRDLNAPDSIAPCAMTYRVRFGTMGYAVRLAGLKIRGQGRPVLPAERPRPVGDAQARTSAFWQEVRAQRKAEMERARARRIAKRTTVSDDPRVVLYRAEKARKSPAKLAVLNVCKAQLEEQVRGEQRAGRPRRGRGIHVSSWGEESA